MSEKIILASNNKGKIREIGEMLSPLGYDVVSMKDEGIDIEIEENGTTFQENAAIKARMIFNMTKCSVIADDSGLMVDFLNGAPGVHSHRYAGENADDNDRIEKLLSEMSEAGENERNAAFVCVMCYIDKSGKEQFVKGECKGTIGYEKKGENGFGYDPVFMYGEKSFAEISIDEKNKISHRAKALKLLCELLKG